MDLLRIGMEYENSESAIKRTLAKGALMVEKKYADLYEAYVDSRIIRIPENQETDTAMLEKIFGKIAETKDA